MSTTSNLYTTKYYKGDKRLKLKITNNSKCVLYEGNEISPDDLINYGVTPYPTQPLLCFKGVCLTLYDEKTGLYFDGRQDLNQWMTTNPTPYYIDIQYPDGVLEIQFLELQDTPEEEVKINHTSYIDEEQKLEQTLYYKGNLIEPTKGLMSLEYMNLISIDTTPDYEYVIHAYIQDENGQTINGIYYLYGYGISVLVFRRGIAGVEYFFYKCNPLFNDDNEHSQQEFNDILILYNLTTTNPTPIIVGVTTELPVCFDTMPETHWWWVGGFSNSPTASSGIIWYNTNTNATPSLPMTDTIRYPVNPIESKYKKCFISNNTTTVEATTLRLYNYTSTYISVSALISASISRSSTRANNVLIVLCNELFIDTTWPLPSDLYSLNGRTITWNTSSKFYKVFEGNEIY